MEHLLNSRIQLKYDTLENWSKTDVAGKGANLVLKSGELGIVYVPAVTTGTCCRGRPLLHRMSIHGLKLLQNRFIL